MGSTVFRIPEDVIKPSGYRPRVLYTSSGILNTVDPLASASNLYLNLKGGTCSPLRENIFQCFLCVMWPSSAGALLVNRVA